MVYVLFAPGFEETEAIAPIDILMRGGVEVTLVSMTDSLCVTGAHGIGVTCTKLLADTDFSNGEMLLLPGGMPGVKNLDEHPATDRILSFFAGRWIAAICAAPSILGKRGLLCGKQFVCYPGFEDACTGGLLQDVRVVRDGKFITAKGAGAASDFGFALLSVLKDPETADKVKASMY